MKKKLLTISIIVSGLTCAQSDNYEDVFHRNKTKYCKSVKQCLILIAKGDTICWNHSKKAKKLVCEQIKEKGSFNHYQYERPYGSPYAK